MTRKEPSTYDGAQLLDLLRDTIRRYVILPSNEALDAVVLWTAATHALPAWACAPRLVIRAPEKRCGKSRLLDLVEAACHHPLITVNASPAAVYRAIGSEHPPTLLIDEYDTIFGPSTASSNEDLRGLLNAGHQRNRPALRYDANAQRVEKIPTFAMAAMAGIGAAPDTIEDRAVVIHMRRRKAREKVQPWRIMRDRPIAASIAEQLNGWLTAHLDQLKAAVPVMPVEDRDADTWEPLIALADLAGGEWPIRARTAAVTLTGVRNDTAEDSERIRLLTDCWTVFNEAGPHVLALPTQHIVDQLKAMDESPWEGLNPHRFGVRLREFGIKSAGSIRFPTGQAKGYSRQSFIDAWDRYCNLTPPMGSGSPVPTVPAVPAELTPGTVENSGTVATVPAKLTVPGLTSDATVGTVGTATPHPPEQSPQGKQGQLRLVRSRSVADSGV